MIQHPIHKNYFIGRNDQFFHRMGPLLVPLTLVRDNISIATGPDERKRYTPAVFRHEIQSVIQKAKNVARNNSNQKA